MLGLVVNPDHHTCIITCIVCTFQSQTKISRKFSLRWDHVTMTTVFSMKAEKCTYLSDAQQIQNCLPILKNNSKCTVEACTRHKINPSNQLVTSIATTDDHLLLPNWRTCVNLLFKKALTHVLLFLIFWIYPDVHHVAMYNRDFVNRLQNSNVHHVICSIALQ